MEERVEELRLIIDLAMRTRKAQKEFFRMRGKVSPEKKKYLLNEARQLEKELDIALGIDKTLSDDGQPSLFN